MQEDGGMFKGLKIFGFSQMAVQIFKVLSVPLKIFILRVGEIYFCAIRLRPNTDIWPTRVRCDFCGGHPVGRVKLILYSTGVLSIGCP